MTDRIPEPDLAFVIRVCEPIREILGREFEDASTQDESAAVLTIAAMLAIASIRDGDQSLEGWLEMCRIAYGVAVHRIAAGPPSILGMPVVGDA